MSDRDNHNLEEILGEKYKIEPQIASNGGRKTLLACNINTQELVVVEIKTS